MKGKTSRKYLQRFSIMYDTQRVWMFYVGSIRSYRNTFRENSGQRKWGEQDVGRIL